MVAIKYTPVGEYFEGLLGEYAKAYCNQDWEFGHRLMGLMRDEFEKQKKETDLKDSSPDAKGPAFEYTWRGLRMDIEGYAQAETRKR